MRFSCRNFLWMHLLLQGLQWLIFSELSVAQGTFIPFAVTGKDSALEGKVYRRYLAEKDTIRFVKKEGKTFITEQCSLRAEYVKAAVQDKMLLSGSFIDQYLQKIVAEIERGNPLLKGRISLLTSRDPDPNAYALGNGIVVMNIGMLNQVNSEAEIAFILCHEFAHDILKHGNQSLYTTAGRITDEALKKELGKTLKEEYNVKKKLIALLMPGLKKSRQYSRELELQADSLGLALLKNTSYNTAGAPNGMDVLDALDVWEDKEALNLKSFFTLPQVPARNSWFDYHGESSLGVGFEAQRDTLLDSLKTHPDCQLRKEKLLLLGAKNTVDLLFLQPEADFNRMKFEADGELIQLLLDWENIDYSTLYSLFSLRKYPTNAYPRSVLALCLAFLSKEKKNLSSSRYMRYNSPDYSDNFNHLLYFLIELPPDDCAALAYWMIRPEQPELREQEVHLAALTLSAFSAGKAEEYLTLRSQYDLRFPEGRYRQFLPEAAQTSSKKRK